jgi:hypothetical protein
MAVCGSTIRTCRSHTTIVSYQGLKQPCREQHGKAEPDPSETLKFEDEVTANERERFLPDSFFCA